MSTAQKTEINPHPAASWKRPKTIWDRGNLAEWRAGLSEYRKRKDEKFLSEIFQEAARVPVLNDALKWAKEHDVEFVVDRKTSVGGRIHSGSGIIAISRYPFPPHLRTKNRDKNEMKKFMVNTLVHEIRHIWQDHHNLLATYADNLSASFINTALVEADAYAHGQLASKQFAMAMLIDSTKNKVSIKNLQKQLDKTTKDTNFLWEEFKNWFPENAEYYSNRALEAFAPYFKIQTAENQSNAVNTDNLHDFNYEWTVPGKKCSGVDWSQWSDLRRLGQSFNGRNYFDTANRDAFCKEFCSASKALTFYGTANDNEIKLSTEIRKAFLRIETSTGWA